VCDAGPFCIECWHNHPHCEDTEVER
jgi:hypothetical protein